MKAVSQISTVWTHGAAAEKQALVQNLFVAVYYDLDTRRITGFKLKPWADQYLVVRANLNGAEPGTDHAESKTAPHRKGMEQHVPLWGRPSFPRYFTCAFRLKRVASDSIRKRAPKLERNCSICQRYAQGETLPDLAAAFEISPQRVHQIIKQAQRFNERR